LSVCKYNVAEKSVLEELVDQIYETTGVGPAYLAVGLSLVVGSALLRIFGFGAFGRCCSFFYLVYMTFKVQETEDGEMKDKIYWLTHWSFYGVFTLFDAITDLVFYWIPYIDALKLFFLAWCLLPQTKGAQHVYYLIIHRGISKYEKSIDEALNSVKTSVSQVMKEVGQLGLEFGLEFLSSMGVNIFQVMSQLLVKVAAASAESLSSPNVRSRSGAAEGMDDIKEES